MRHARAAAARLWELDGSPGQLKKNELASLLVELQAAGGTIKPTDGKRERLIPAFHDHADKLGCWENMVCALWAKTKYIGDEAAVAYLCMECITAVA